MGKHQRLDGGTLSCVSRRFIHKQGQPQRKCCICDHKMLINEEYTWAGKYGEKEITICLSCTEQIVEEFLRLELGM